MAFFRKKDNSRNKIDNSLQVENSNNDAEKEFDLNIEKILENWDVYHAIREIIANALDEQIITNTDEIKIYKEKNIWHIVDYGRGLNYHHLTQNENEEKLNNDKLIGRFGVGLKDALATLYRHDLKVTISSKFGVITLNEMSKAGFEDIVTLHAKIGEATNKNKVGTDFAIEGCKDEDIEKAKSLFLKFANPKIEEETIYGQVIRKSEENAYIYINGVKVAEEPKFLYSYNITSLTKQIKKALNRERTNVGRTAYSDRIKSILLACKSEIVLDELIEDLQQFNTGLRHDETSWSDVALYVSKKIGERKTNIVFVSSDTTINEQSVVDEMKLRGLKPVVVPENLISKIDEYNEANEEDSSTVVTRDVFVRGLQENKKYNFIDYKNLSNNEKKVWDYKDRILELIGGKPSSVLDIKVSETIYESEFLSETVGLWDALNQWIIIKRSQLSDIRTFSGTLIHECVHAESGYGDVSRNFEMALTDTIGEIAGKIFVNK